MTSATLAVQMPAPAASASVIASCLGSRFRNATTAAASRIACTDALRRVEGTSSSRTTPARRSAMRSSDRSVPGFTPAAASRPDTFVLQLRQHCPHGADAQFAVPDARHNHATVLQTELLALLSRDTQPAIFRHPYDLPFGSHHKPVSSRLE
jgi:hypothetical protein